MSYQIYLERAANARADIAREFDMKTLDFFARAGTHAPLFLDIVADLHII